jgi:antirestriction protein ArdC
MYNRNSQDKPPPRDYRAEVTADIIKLLEEGAAPWQKPWEAGEAGRMPFNPTTNKTYRGGNVLALMIAGMRNGYEDPRWMTYKQAAEKGWQVRKGEKASQIEFWEAKSGSKEDEASEDEKRSRLIHRVYSVFNAEQIDGPTPLALPKREPWEICEAGERIMNHSGADIRYGGGRAFYRKDTDHVQLPPRECFADAPGFYGTAIHELVHWTGGEKRLKRPTLIESKSFGDDSYAKEELRAELGSMMLSAEQGIPHDPSQHAAYVQSWIKALKNDKNEIFKAAADASKACDFLLQRERENTNEAEQVSHVERLNAEQPQRQEWAR